VENGLPLVRSANNGITCWIDEHGRVRQIFRAASGSEYAAGSVMMEIPLRSAEEKSVSTFYHRHGDWFGWVCATITVASMLRTLRKRARP